MKIDNVITKNLVQLESNFASYPQDGSMKSILYSRSGQLYKVVEKSVLNENGQHYLDYLQLLNTGSSEQFYYSVFNLTTPGCSEGCDFCFEEITRRREKWNIESIPFLVALHHIMSVVKAIQDSDEPNQLLIICNNSNPKEFLDKEFFNREGEMSDLSDFLFEVGSSKLGQKIRIQLNVTNRRKKRDLRLNKKIVDVCQQFDSEKIKVRLSAHFRNNFYRKFIKGENWQSLENEYIDNVVEAVTSLQPLCPDIAIRLSSWKEFDIYMKTLPKICQQLNELGCQYNIDHRDPAITIREDYSNPIQDEDRLFPTNFKRSREITNSSVRCEQGTFVSNDFLNINADQIDFETGGKIENYIREALLYIKQQHQISNK
jgi:hypothetical protein